mgnify:CR=1 FL=1
MRVLVVGAGIAGSSFARLGVAAGLDVTVVADPRLVRSSEAALCVTRPSWFAGQALEECEWTLDWYRAHGWLTDGIARYGSYRSTKVEDRPGYFAVDPVAPLVDPDILDDWRNVADDYDLRVLARGSHSDLDWRRQHGATTIVESDGHALPLVAYHDRPRSVMFAVCHDGDTVRVGSSKALTVEQAIERQHRDYEKALAFGLVERGEASLISGVRLVPPPGVEPGALRWLDDRTVAVEGFGRVGYSLAPAKMAALVRQVTP